MSRTHLKLLEDCVNDFNKELNPFLKQKKVTVWCEKVRHLLFPAHFIKYGRSTAIQDLLNCYDQFKNAAPTQVSKKLTGSLTIQFRDYLITSLVIGNGLRASNVTQLRLKDFEEYKMVKDYAGHKVITNDNYKTSTIYGEKFIVVLDALFEHYSFYIHHLRTKVSNVKSTCVFLPASSNNAEMSQSNVTTSLTASFKLANVLKRAEYLRVYCTRIRCGIAAFACNDGGVDSGIFACHFMKNSEETTNLHYNLLWNPRHALNTAMKLYESFTVNSRMIDISKEHVAELSQNLTKSAEKVLDWLVKNNSDLTKKEICDFKAILKEIGKDNP